MPSASWERDALKHRLLRWRARRREQEVDLNSIVSAEWRAYPDRGSVRLGTGVESYSLRFIDFPRDQRLDLIRCLRRILPGEAQNGWPEFCRRVARPLRRSFEPPRPAGPGERLLTRRRWDAIGGGSVLIFVAAGVFMWRVTGRPQAFAAVPMSFALWMFLRYTHPKSGIVVSRDIHPPGSGLITTALCVSWLTIAVRMAVAAPRLKAGNNGWLAAVVFVAICVSGLVPTIAIARRYAPARKAWEDRKAAEAVAEGDRRESAGR